MRPTVSYGRDDERRQAQLVAHIDGEKLSAGRRVTFDPKLLTPMIVSPFAAWGIFRRVRWAFGRQPVQVRRIWFRIGVLALVSGFVLVTSAARNIEMLLALAAGIVGGAVLANVGLRHTKFEVTREGRFYTPHTYMGVLVTALFFSRLVYRFLCLSSSGSHSLAGAHQLLLGSYRRNPLTLGIFAALVAYYVLLYLGVLAVGHHGSPRKRALRGFGILKFSPHSCRALLGLRCSRVLGQVS